MEATPEEEAATAAAEAAVQSQETQMGSAGSQEGVDWRGHKVVVHGKDGVAIAFSNQSGAGGFSPPRWLSGRIRSFLSGFWSGFVSDIALSLLFPR